MQRWPQHWKWIATVAAIGALAMLYLFSPERYWIYPRCLFHEVTGLECPGCGSLRSVHHLLHGDLAVAFRFNPLLYVLVPALVICRRHLHKPVWLWSFVGVVLVFAVARNL